MCIAQIFRSSGAFKVGVVPQFYKHFVRLGLKTTTENQNCLHCDNFRNGTLELRPLKLKTKPRLKLDNASG